MPIHAPILPLRTCFHCEFEWAGGIRRNDVKSVRAVTQEIERVFGLFRAEGRDGDIDRCPGEALESDDLFLSDIDSTRASERAGFADFSRDLPDLALL